MAKGDEAHKRQLALAEYIEEGRRTLSARSTGAIRGGHPEGTPVISPMGDSENWMQIVRRMRENGVPEGGYPDTVAGNRKMDAARELAANQLKQERKDRKLRREARAKKKRS